MVQVVPVTVRRGGRLVPREPVLVDERTHQPMTVARIEAEAIFGRNADPTTASGVSPTRSGEDPAQSRSHDEKK